MTKKSLLVVAVGPLVVISALALGGCAVGNRYDYSGSIAGLPISGPGKVALQVVDARPYVVSGEKKPDFIGLQRGGFGNPFDVRTASGRPMADEMRDAIAKALEKQGFTVVPAGDAAPRRMELRVAEWKTDAMMHFGLTYDLVLSIYGADGALMAKSEVKGKEEQGVGFESQNAVTAARMFEMKFTQLVSDKGVREAMTETAQ